MKVQEFILKDKDYIDLCDLLKISALCESGGVAKHMISEGLVKVDNEIELRKRAKIRRGQIVEFQSNKVKVL